MEWVGVNQPVWPSKAVGAAVAGSTVSEDDVVEVDSTLAARDANSDGQHEQCNECSHNAGNDFAELSGFWPVLARQIFRSSFFEAEGTTNSTPMNMNPRKAMEGKTGRDLSAPADEPQPGDAQNTQRHSGRFRAT